MLTTLKRPVIDILGAKEGIPTSQPLPILDSSILLSMHQLMSIMMSQLQPVLESFNQTLQHLSGEVDALSRDMQQLRLEQFGDASRRTEARSGNIEEKLEYSHLQISEMKTQLDTQKDQMERAFQIQQDILQHNLTKLKDEMEDQISQSIDAQVNLQSLSVLVEKVRLGQKRLEGTLQRERAESVEPAQESRVWEAITRLDERAQKNSAQLSSLSDTSEDTASALQTLRENLLNLGQKVEEVKKDSEVHFAETGLEVEAVRVRVLHSISELKANVSAHEGQLREIELDLNNIYHQLKRNDSPIAAQACNCASIADSLVRLEMEVANVTRLAKKNQLAFEDAEMERSQTRWMTEVEDLHQGLLNMKESLAFEQGRSRIINNNISQLKASLLDSQMEMRSLKEKDEAKSTEIQGLAATFSSLLSDALRHSEVLEVLLGEEVLEFTTWSHNQQKELSIPNLLQKIHSMQHKIENHDRSLASLRKKRPEEGEMHSDDPVAYSDWTSTKNQLGYPTPDPSTGEDEDDDYSVSDFWSLGKEVEELAGRINLLEESCGNCTVTPGGSAVELQVDIASLRQTLEDHLRTFEKLFSHTEELTSSGRSLNLDDVWKLVRRKERNNRRQNPNQEKTESGNENSSRRGKRYNYVLLPLSPVVFVSNLDHRTTPSGELTSTNTAVNHGGAFNPTSRMFCVPQTGLYLVLVTLDFQRGHSSAVLKRSGVPVASLTQEHGGLVSRSILLELRQRERVTLQLMRGSLRKAQVGDNALSGLLLYTTEDKDVL
ncbi:putative multimerin-2 [Triplophysa rosa]|uniref:Multimerin-2 n=1 Tax=Triplophysa rosa TaxID=992332 RepID=A0A9W7TID8_TRIRA|nr:putative multimerin-2 [Triplophysa rosa]